MLYFREETVNEFIQYVELSSTFRWIEDVFGLLWRDPGGRAFTLTATAYFFGYLMHTGYWMYFARGMSGLAFSRLGVGLTDILLLLPSALSAMVTVIQHLIKPLLLFLAYIFSTVFLSFITTRLLEPYSIVPTNLGVIGGFSFFLNLLAAIFIAASEMRHRKRRIALLGLLQVVGYVLVLVSTPPAASSAAQLPPASPNPLDPLFREVAAWSLILIALTLPLEGGRRIAQEALEQRFLSQVSVLVLKAPVPDLVEFAQQSLVPHSDREGTRDFAWFRKPPHREEPPQASQYVYTSSLNQPLYVVASSSHNLALCIPGTEVSERKLVLVPQELVLAQTLARLREQQSVSK
jgi:hypothetical protein